VNYFPYGYAAPKNNQAFAAALEVASAPWAPEHRLVRIGLKARDIATAQRGPANLVFVLDVSASMGEANKLSLVRESIQSLIGKLRPDDKIAIVTYAANSAVVLPSTPIARANEILAALARLKTGGTTGGASGLPLAYGIAIANFTKTGLNQVLLCTDGVLNLGATSERQLLQLIEEKTRTGIALTVLGLGEAAGHSTPLERLAQKAGATYGTIDSRREAEKFLVDQVSSSLANIARDVKVQVEFNPAKVLAYRLIG
jgi:Ca-activated chloride channel homolog